ncbi:hypothetical protein INT43_005549 [Umbelopsis isabellina]|uniref:ABC transporter domain-containing protein n=1 Tax=Mortierella isabellina TaxID=91625 RepID=A0A8H7UB25_MORIS|nr:hypothetical protein INT43_005549 [Umbelopsis isabellina]
MFSSRLRRAQCSPHRRFFSTTFNSLQKTLIEFDNANVHRFGNKKPAFKNLNWKLQDGERWVVVGPVSAGKSTFAEAVSGKHLVQPLSAGRWPFISKEKSPYPSDHVKLVSFRENSSLFSYGKHYYQERFNFSDPENDITLRSYLLKDQIGTDSDIQNVAKLLGIDHMLEFSFMKLSNGQTRRARIARALLTNPEMLVLDEPLMGLDVANRSKILNILGNLSARVLLVLRPQDELPDWATDVLELGDMQVQWSGKLEDYKKRVAQTTAAKKEKAEQVSKSIPTGGEPIVELHNVNVSYGGRRIIKDLDWTVRKGERWALLGPNGSGKTTLLSLLTGDHPQAYANDMSLFGRKRGTGESIWDIKQRIGLVSPEIHLYFNQQMTALAAAGTGFFDVVVPKKLSSEQETSVRKLFDEFSVKDLVDRKLMDMSTGEQRLVLLIRSLVKSPSLLVWDEPFQGLDDKMIGSVTRWLENHMRADQTLIIVTHHEEEIPAAVNQRFNLPMISDKV